VATIISNAPIPGLKISGVGSSRKKKKKGGGFFGFGSKAAEEAGSLVRARAATSVLSAGAAPALGGAARAALPFGAKVFMTLMLGIAGFGVYSARQAFNRRPMIPAVNPRVFAPRPAPQAPQPQAPAEATSNLPSDNQGYSSLNMVHSGLPEMQAPPPQPPAAAAPPPAQPASPAVPDLSALAQAAKAAKGGNGGSPFDSKVGQLDSAMPSLSGGGPGLSGGVGMPFQKMQPAGFLQKPKPMAMAQTAPSMGMAHGGGMGGVGKAFNQARNASAYGAAAANSNGAGAAYNSGGQFDSPMGSPATMGSPQGIGAGTGLLGAADTNPSTNPNGSGQPSSGGGGGGYGNPNYCPGCIPGNQNPSNVTPWGPQASLAGLLTWVALGLLATAAILDLTLYEGWWNPAYVQAVMTTVHTLAILAAGVGLAIIGLGIDIVTQGQTLQGLMFTGIGAATIYAAHLVGQGAATAASAAQTAAQNGATTLSNTMSNALSNTGSFFGVGDTVAPVAPPIYGPFPASSYL
jgi:hypothetical protein